MSREIYKYIYFLALTSCHMSNGEGTQEIDLDHVVIKDEWDYSPHIDKELNNYHVIRKREQELLIDFLYRKNEGVLLISGRRGVGKTSSIFHAINKVQVMLKKGKGTIALPVLINAPNFEIYTQKESDSEEDDLPEFKRIILQDLVRGLYKVGVEDNKIEGLSTNETSMTSKKELQKDKNLREKVTELFRRAVAKEVKEETGLKDSELDKEQTIRENLKSFKISGWAAVLSAAFIIIAVLIALNIIPGTDILNKSSLNHTAVTAVLNKSSLNHTAVTAMMSKLLEGVRSGSFLGRIVPILVAAIPPVLITIGLDLKRTRTIEQIQKKDNSIYYRYDYNLSTLQSELQRVLQDLSTNHYRVIFVIDELDKVEESRVIEVVQSLKSLFNQGSALFVLITGDRYYNTIKERRILREKEYTVFPQKIFLMRPQSEEIRKFMDNIMDMEVSGPAIQYLFTWDQINTDKPIKLEEFLPKDGKRHDDDLEKLRDADIIKTNDNNIKITFKNNSVLIKNDQDTTTSILTISSNEKEKDLEQNIETILNTPLFRANKFSSILASNMGDFDDTYEGLLHNKIDQKFEFCTMNIKSKHQVYTRTAKYRNFQRYASYLARSDFFDLYNVLRDHVVYSSSDSRSRLKINISLDEKQITQADLQEIIEKIYSKQAYTHLSDWNENEKLLDLMYELVSTLVDRKAGTNLIKIEDTPFKIIFLNDKNEVTSQIPLKKNKDELGADYEKAELSDVEKNALMALINTMIENRFLGATKITQQYTVMGTLKGKAETLTKDENVFLNEYRYTKYMASMYADIYSIYSDIRH